MQELVRNEVAVTSISKAGKNSTTNEEYKERKKIYPQIVATVIASLASFSYGTSVGWPSPVVLDLQSDNPPIGEHPITDEDVSWIGSLVFLGFSCGTPIYSYASDKLGRKAALLLTSVPIIINWLMIIFGESVSLILAARFIIGFGIGGVLPIIPIYVGEISEVHIRGALGTLISVLANAGILFTYIVGSYTQYHNFAIICLAVPLLFVVTFVWMPETPIYLLGNGKLKEAKKALKTLRGSSGPHINEELAQMALLIKEIRESSSKGRIIKDLLFNKGSRKALIIGVTVSVTQVCSGLFVIISYNGTIFKMSGADMPPHISSIIVGGILLLAPILSCPLMDRAGRKVLLVSSLVIMTICLTILGAYFYLDEIGTDLRDVGYIPVVCMGVYLLCLGMGLGPVNMVLFSEIFLPHVRSTSASVSTFMVAIFSFVVTRFYNDLSNVIGIYGSFWFFAMCCLLGMLFSIVAIPETKNRTVESIYAELNGEGPGMLPIKKEYKLDTVSGHLELEGELSSIKSF